ncbi:MAG: flagellar basal body L-ring protein FlgH [Bdellovibrionaceae bacterium]|nr:flagellar basal body L-ring protein FlgH [Pseudobdellovibrionaceae bacterium]
MIRTTIYFSLLFSFLFMLSGCATMEQFLAKLNGPKEKAVVTEDSDGQSIRYSENPQMSVPSNRQYKRMTRSRMEDESDLGSQAGSMWVMEGQGAYLFAQNKARREGDVMNVKLDGPSLKQVETKVGVIKKLLKQLEDQQQAELNNGLAAAGTDGSRAPASATTAAAAAAPTAAPTEVKKDEKEDMSGIQQVTTKIVERLPDGNYRVRGAQPFMIGKREYKVIAAGIVRPEDFNDEGVSSSKLIDPQFDVVSIRRKPTNE